MRKLFFALLLISIGWSGPAAAAIEIGFYSKDFASTFPHGFVRLTGTVDSTGEQIDTNYGFTPVRISPKILMGSVPGRIQTVDARYVVRSDLHFALKLDEAQYRLVMATVEHWRSIPQPSYLLNSRNCVYFVAEVAQALGLRADPVPQLMKKPKSFLAKVTRDNQALIATWKAPPVVKQALHLRPVNAKDSASATRELDSANGKSPPNPPR